MDLVIRRARPEDSRGIGRVHAASWQEAYREILPEAYLRTLTLRSVSQSWRRRLYALPPGERCWVACVDDTVVGFCLAGPARGDREWAGWAAEVSYLYVHPRILGEGVGGALLRHVLDWLAFEGYLWVGVGVLRDNARARGFYEHLGLRYDGASWVDSRFHVTVVRHEMALNPVCDFDAFRGTAKKPR